MKEKFRGFIRDERRTLKWCGVWLIFQLSLLILAKWLTGFYPEGSIDFYFLAGMVLQGTLGVTTILIIVPIVLLSDYTPIDRKKILAMTDDEIYKLLPKMSRRKIIELYTVLKDLNRALDVDKLMANLRAE